MSITARFYDTVTVRAYKGNPSYDMPCHVSYTQSWAADESGGGPSGSVVVIVGIMRIAFPKEYSLDIEQEVEYHGQVWRAYLGDQIHSRRGRIEYRTADLKRGTLA